MLLFSITCFVAICIVLLVFQNKVRPEMAYDLSLNAIVSVLATGCKSALILVVGEAICQLKWLHFGNAERKKLSDMQEFEEASRGPLGSLTILVRHRANSLVSIGAAVVVLMLAFDPFMQQLISYPVWPVDVQNGQAVVKQLHNFGYGEDVLASNPPDGFGDINKWRNAFARGVWVDGSFSTQPICSSGDCTWETFSSVGICSRCWDLTSAAQVKCELPNSATHSNGSCQIVMPESYMVGYTFQVELDHATYQPDPPQAPEQYILLRFPSSMVWTPFTSGGPNASDLVWSNATFDGMVQPLVAYAYAQLEFEMVSGASPSTPISDSISIKNMTMCSHGTCLRDYKVSMHDGQASIQAMNVDFGTRVVATFPCWAPTNKSKAAFTICNGVESVPFSSQGFFPVESITRFENSTGKWSYGWDTDDEENPLVYRIEEIGFEKMISNIAASYTQTGLEVSTDSVNGTVHSSKVFVSVQWYWLILPTLLMVTGSIFFAVTVLVNRRARIPLWKSSALAPFYHGLEKLGEGNFVSTSAMGKTANGVEVHLRDTEDDERLMLRG